MNYSQDYLAEFKLTESELTAYQLVEEYYQKCETYDLTVCTGPLTKDGIMPATRHEFGLINAHSLRLWKETKEKAQAQGIGMRLILEAKGRYLRMR